MGWGGGIGLGVQLFKNYIRTINYKNTLLLFKYQRLIYVMYYNLSVEHF